MRKELLILATAAIALAGCKTGTEDYTQCGIECPPPADGGGTDPDPDPDPDPDAGGNDTSLTTGNTTITLEDGKLLSSASLSTLAISADPSTATMQIDTKTDSNGDWLDPVAMNEYVPGSTAVDFFAGAPPQLGATSYKEYRNISAVVGAERDELLQVWTWNHSRAMQYRNSNGGGIGKQQAFAFEGDETNVASLPTAGTGNYQGSFGSTSTASNWIQPDPPADPAVFSLSRNGVYQANGSANIDVNFGSGAVTGVLQPERWKYFDETAKSWVYYDAATNLAAVNGALRDADAPGFFNTEIGINGTLSGSNISGTANLGDGFVSGDNPVKGGLYGDGAAEITGVFAVRGVAVDPVGGEFPIDDDRRGYLTHSGVFNGQCQAGTACTP